MMATSNMRLPFSLLFFLEHITGKDLRGYLAMHRERAYPLVEADVSPSHHLRYVHDAAEAAALFRNATMPLIWKGGAAGSHLARWNLAYLRKHAGEIPVKILSLAGLDPDKNEYSDRVMPFRDYLKLMNRRKIYLRFSDFLDQAHVLAQDLPMQLLSDLSGHPRRTNTQFFLGPKGTRTPLHAEMNCNVFIQVFGRKRWVVFPPGATTKLNPPAAGRFYFFSPLDPLDRKYKRAKNHATGSSLHGIEIILEPGDILMVPPLVWHAVENLTESCSIGYKFNRYFHAFRLSPLLFAMNVLARDPSYPVYLWHAFVRKRHPILASR